MTAVQTESSTELDPTLSHTRGETDPPLIEQTIGALYRYREMLDLGRYPSFAWQMISHKVLRYAVPALLVALLAANVALANTSPFYNLMLFGQAAFYGAAIMGWLAEREAYPMRSSMLLRGSWCSLISRRRGSMSSADETAWRVQGESPQSWSISSPRDRAAVSSVCLSMARQTYGDSMMRERRSS